MKKKVLLLLMAVSSLSIQAQFHTLNIPKSSQLVEETQKLGVTSITINYSSPAINGRDVWNTTISFSTDVSIEGHLLKAGKYGFHIIPKGDNYTLLFAHNSNQWGSYYLDIENDVTLSVDVESTTSPFSEQLDYEFLSRKENSLVIGLEWGEKRIPFNVSVDLNKTVVESFRSELRGINTYHWQAWNDAATWCLDHSTNLEEALVWANRSINGGYSGFALNKNLTNLTTKINALVALGKQEEVENVMAEAIELSTTPNEAYGYSVFLLRNNYYQEALMYCNTILKEFPSSWSLELNKGVSYYFLKDKKAAIKSVRKVLTVAPDQFTSRLNEIISEMESDTYKLPGS